VPAYPRTLALVVVVSSCSTEWAQVIVDKLDWKEMSQLQQGSPEWTNARAVGYLQFATQPCTGWLVNQDIVVTARHCVASAVEANGAQITFDRHDQQRGPETWYPCAFLQAWDDIDVSVLRCGRPNDKPSTRYGMITLASTNSAANDRVYVIHQNCDYHTDSRCTRFKKLSPGRVKRTDLPQEQLSHNADTLPGSSGGAAFAESGVNAHKLTFMHRSGSGGNARGRGAENYGVHVTALRKKLAPYLP
jgi:V8-like Glu-specific endopeptidase